MMYRAGDQSARYHFAQNGNYSVSALVKRDLTPGATPAFSVVERYEYSSIYGVHTVTNASSAADPNRGDRVLALSEEVGNPFRFQGRRFDDESGLYYFRARYLDPEHGRFVNRDPKGIWGDPGALGNGYAFCEGNPVNRVDPFGEQGRRASTIDCHGQSSAGRPAEDKVDLWAHFKNAKIPRRKSEERRIRVYLVDPRIADDPLRSTIKRLRTRIQQDISYLQSIKGRPWPMQDMSGQIETRTWLLYQLDLREQMGGATYALGWYVDWHERQQLLVGVASAYAGAGLALPGSWMRPHVAVAAPPPRGIRWGRLNVGSEFGGGWVPSEPVTDRSNASRYYRSQPGPNGFKFESMAWVDETGELTITLNLKTPTGERGSMSGHKEFAAIFSHFEGQFTTFKAQWRYGDNLAKFNELTTLGPMG